MKDNNNKILYISAIYPYPKDCGEDFTFSKNIGELATSKYIDNTTLILGNKKLKQGEFPYPHINYEMFPYKKKSMGVMKKAFLYLFYVLFSKYPRGFTSFLTKELYEKINSEDANIVILDSIYSAAMLPKKNNYKLLYIVHNCEAILAYDIAKIQKNIFKKIYFYLQAKKIEKIENELISKADLLLCISTSDYKYFSKLYHNKTKFRAISANTGNGSWNGNNKKTLLFCGTIGHAPNKEAIEWIANYLSPILDKDIQIKIAGRRTNQLPKELDRPNIEYLGFVSDDELKKLYQTCSAFISPVVYGSGVKIKVTEAISYGMPIIATKESLEGLDYIDINPLIDRNNLQKTKENIEKLLNNEIKLQQYSDEIIEKLKKAKEKENENILEKIMDELLYKTKADAKQVSGEY